MGWMYVNVRASRTTSAQQHRCHQSCTPVPHAIRENSGDWPCHFGGTIENQRCTFLVRPGLSALKSRTMLEVVGLLAFQICVVLSKILLLSERQKMGMFRGEYKGLHEPEAFSG